MHKTAFANGGFALHRVFLPNSVCKFSAWYDKQGTLLDAEKIDGAGRSFNPNDKQMNHLKQLGKIWC